MGNSSNKQIEVTATADEERTLATITMAFTNDPVVRWVFPDPNQYLTYWGPFAKAFAGGTFAAGTVDSVDECRGVAMWLPPGIRPDDEQVEAIATEGIAAADHDKVFGVLEQMDGFHPDEAHWYLPLIGVDVTRHGHGYGSALLRHALERCGKEGLPAYLEATSPQNRSLYARHGFEEIGVIQGADSPPMWPMLHKP